MMNHARHTLVFLLCLALGLGNLAMALPAATGSSLEGRVFESDLATPADGLAVQVIPQGSEKAVTSTTTDERGHFELEGVPSGEILLVLLDSTGEPVGASRIDTRVAPPQPLTLALAPANTENDESQGGFWQWVSTPVGATIALLVVGAGTAVLVDELLDDENKFQDLEPVSESEPR